MLHWPDIVPCCPSRPLSTGRRSLLRRLYARGSAHRYTARRTAAWTRAPWCPSQPEAPSYSSTVTNKTMVLKSSMGNTSSIKTVYLEKKNPLIFHSILCIIITIFSLLLIISIHDLISFPSDAIRTEPTYQSRLWYVTWDTTSQPLWQTRPVDHSCLSVSPCLCAEGFIGSTLLPNLRYRGGLAGSIFSIRCSLAIFISD